MDTPRRRRPRALRLAPCALLLLAPAARALDPQRALTQYRLDRWHTAQGLPQSSVESLAQTPDGYLWLGTQEGLARFDCRRLVVFDKANTRELRHNRVVALLAGQGGALWIGTEGGGLSVLQDGRFRTLTTGDGLPSDRV